MYGHRIGTFVFASSLAMGCWWNGLVYICVNAFMNRKSWREFSDGTADTISVVLLMMHAYRCASIGRGRL